MFIVAQFYIELLSLELERVLLEMHCSYNAFQAYAVLFNYDAYSYRKRNIPIIGKSNIRAKSGNIMIDYDSA